MDEMDDDDAHQDTPRAFLDCSISRLAFAKVTFQVGRPAIKWHLLCQLLLKKPLVPFSRG